MLILTRKIGEMIRIGDEVTVRVLATTRRDLPLLVGEGAFREDLFYRINVLTIELPPLRGRRRDIAILLEHFVVEAARELGRELWSLDLTSDLGIPAFAAVSRRVDVPREDVILGFAAHVDARTALVRAMTEINQSLPSVPGPGDGPHAPLRGDNHEAIRWWSTATVAGTAPAARTVASDTEPTSRFCGHGSPWASSVDSSATTG